MSVKLGDTIYVTKYAMVTGIETTTVTRVSETCVGLVSCQGYCVSLAAGDYALTLDEAGAQVKGMRERRRASLLKQLATLDDPKNVAKSYNVRPRKE